MSALHIAIQGGHIEVVEVLTHKMDKDDLNARDDVRMIHNYDFTLSGMHRTMLS